MFKTVALASIGSAAAVSRTSNFYEGKFFDWMQEHKKSFANGAEFAKRLAIFAENLDFIDETNGKSLSYTLGTNEFSHLTHEEFLDTMHIGALRPPMLRRAADTVHVATSANPASVDWTTVANVVTPVKNQGNCGSCWAFSAVAALEGAYGIKYGNQADKNGFSEQQLVSCDVNGGDAGCNGGWMDDAFDYVGKNNGLSTETNYPYTSGNTGASGSCKSGIVNVAAVDVASHVDVTVGSVSALESAVALTPVSIAIQANQKAFQSYKSGIITEGCGQRLDHGVLAVGYGVDNGTPYWKVRNSWGASWGEGGYVRILKDSSDQCGVLDAASYPKLV